MPGIWLFACLTNYYRLKQRKTMDSMIGQQEISRTSCRVGTKSSVYGRTLASYPGLYCDWIIVIVRRHTNHGDHHAPHS